MSATFTGRRRRCDSIRVPLLQRMYLSVGFLRGRHDEADRA